MNYAFKPIIDVLRQNQERVIDDRVECITCGKVHKPIHKFNLSRDRWACSDDCWDDWMQFGRWER